MRMMNRTSTTFLDDGDEDDDDNDDKGDLVE